MAIKISGPYKGFFITVEATPALMPALVGTLAASRLNSGVTRPHQLAPMGAAQLSRW